MDNGYAVGYLDDGEFVEVGRFNNLDAVANSDLEIRHADSETRVVLGDEGFDFDGSDVAGIEALDVQSASVPQVTSNVDFNSNDATGIGALEAESAIIDGTIFYADDRENLLNILEDGSNEDTVYLGEGVFDDISIGPDDPLKIIGTGWGGTGTRAENWTVDNRANLSGFVQFRNITISGDRCNISEIYGRSGNDAVLVTGDDCNIHGVNRLDITFDSGTSGNIVDSAVDTSVTDNGSNTIGDLG